MDFEQLKKQVKKLSETLDKRVVEHTKIATYLTGKAEPPPAVVEAKLTKAYRHLMPLSDAPWGSLILDSKLDRLEVIGIRDTDQAVADRIWTDVWKANELGSESKLGHKAALHDGRCHATVWPGADGKPDVALDDVTQMIVEYAEGSRRHRTAALRRWSDGDRVYATLYRPEGIYKFQGPEKTTHSASVEWEKRIVEDEDWPLANPFRPVVPVVELAVNRELRPGRFPVARGEFAHCLGLLDRINLLTFLGLVVALWQGFPMRGLIGEQIRTRILRDDEGNPLIDPETQKPETEQLPPFEQSPDSVFQATNPEAKIAEFEAADRKNLSIFAELEQLAVVTKTPRHYFPMEGGLSNIAVETIHANEGAMHAANASHKASLGGGWEEIGRLGGKLIDVSLSPSAEIDWSPSESRSLAEMADAASKLKGVLPPVAVAELALNASPDKIARWLAMEATNPLIDLLKSAEGEPAGAGGAG